jgi:hypothetical protein
MRATLLFRVLPLMLLLATHNTAVAQEITFRGVCDGSGGIALPDGRIATVDAMRRRRLSGFTPNTAVNRLPRCPSPASATWTPNPTLRPVHR